VHPVEVDIVVISESVGEFPDAFLGAALLPGVNAIVDERYIYRISIVERMYSTIRCGKAGIRIHDFIIPLIFNHGDHTSRS